MMNLRLVVSADMTLEALGWTRRLCSTGAALIFSILCQAAPVRALFLVSSAWGRVQDLEDDG